jgi:tripartite-type tricarboxylate transporter receptor subunit TctC
MSQKITRALVACWALFFAASPSHAQSVEEFYAGKTISFYIGTSVGGGYDAYGRLVARHIGKYIPGNPTIVPLNMEGTGSLRLTNWLFEAAPQDGSVIGLLNRGVAFVPLLGARQFAQFDAKAFNWLGSASDDVSLCIAHARTGLTRFEQLYEQELIVGNTGPGADGSFMTHVVSGLLGARLRAVTGYAGGNEIDLAIEQGEVDGRCGLAFSALKTARPQWREDGTINILIQLGLREHLELSDVPSVTDLPLNAEERQILRLIMLRGHFGRPFAAPPNVPGERVSALRAALEDSLNDPQLLMEAEQLRIEISPVSGQQLDARLIEAYDTAPELVERAREILNER